MYGKRFYIIFILSGFILNGCKPDRFLLPAKEVLIDESLEQDVELDTNITLELKKEGEVREFIRAVQDLRKEKGLTPDQKITLQIGTSPEGRSFLESAQTEIMKPTNVSSFNFSQVSAELIQIGEFSYKINIIS